MSQSTTSLTSQLALDRLPKATRVHWDLYPPHTPIAVVKFFEEQLVRLQCMPTALTRVRITYGDAVTGCVCDIGPDEGYVDLACGERGEPLRFMLLRTCRSRTGPGVMMGRVIRIEKTRRGSDSVIYRHPNYHQPEPDETPQLTQSPGRVRQFRNVRHSP